MSSVEYNTSDGIATVRLNRPDSLNAMNSEVMNGLSDAFAAIDVDRSIRVVVLTGAGRGFCAGADLRAVREGGAGAADPETMETMFNPAMRAIAACPVPTVARINGVAAGGGFGLAMSCDISIAASSAFFVSTFGPRLGIVPDLGTSYHLPLRTGAARARGIAMLGGRVTAAQAVEWGLIWQAVDDDQLDAAVDEVTTTLKRSSPTAMTRIRSAISEAPHNTLSEQLDLELRHQRDLIPLNLAEGAAAFVDKREPNFSPTR
ncbi:MAG: enoyl-CoA hydratase-related protein [Ilumatobacter sp.]|jgi:2-(1,2-epoxy-1,2-dihydrophenyl)acetyl-CoA isomerase|uniref:enoyl-CoA hydratase/isomerase family protein n=1 Tax=uncultured Ilumatobacter sp. TaxID=879968 RepID=UPI003591EEBC|tara:strand:+ start:1458 stop:2240 length:783 start_codon:yes stop_codon:yes gene_type:complete